MPPDTRGVYAARTQELRDFCSWLAARGHRPERTRIGEYLRYLEAQLQIPEDHVYSPENQYELAVRLREIDELLWIHAGLRLRDAPGTLDVLERVLKGATESRAEQPNESARNFQFELRIASYFLHAGYDIDLSLTSDLTASLPWGEVIVECKRLHSRKKVTERTRDAADQLLRRYGTTARTSCCGIAALDVSRILHPNQGITIARSPDEAIIAVQRELRTFVDEHKPQRHFKTDGRTLAIWLHATVPSFIHSQWRINTLFCTLIVPMQIEDEQWRDARVEIENIMHQDQSWAAR